MPPVSSLRRRLRLLGWLRLSLVAGALYDLIFAALMVVAPAATAAFLDLPLPGETFYLWLLAILLTMLALLYLAAAQDPRRYTAVVWVAIAGRLAGAGAFALAAYGRPELQPLYLVAAADAAFGLLHAALARPLSTG
ncbi:MAG: hypothetical protein AAF481_16940 [Acidobacteriota bacterium]